jgi:Peptidase S24-like
MNRIKKENLSSKGKRLKYIRRSLLRLTRGYIEEKYGLSETTLKSWENERVDLTKNGLKKCIEIYRKEGVIVGEDWILEGVGLNPTASITIGQYFAAPTNRQLSEKDDEMCMLRDANIFKESYSNAVIMMVSSDEMKPFYKPGDYIGGKIRKNIKTAVNKNCIVYLQDGTQFFRRLVKNSAGGYNLICLNPTDATPEPVLFNVEIQAVAPVIWHRCKDE